MYGPSVCGRIGGGDGSDLSALSGMTELRQLHAFDNEITDVSVLQGMTNATWFKLYGNLDLANIQPLINNPGLGSGDTVQLDETSVTCTDVAALEAKGVAVFHNCAPPGAVPHRMSAPQPSAAYRGEDPVQPR